MAKRFIPPTIAEIQAYLDEHPELDALTAEEFFGDYAPEWIDTYGKPVRNWKLKIRTRNRMAERFGNPKKKKTKLYPKPGKQCEVCGMPAVYNVVGGSYDHWKCAEHMPDKVKEKYE